MDTSKIKNKIIDTLTFQRHRNITTMPLFNRLDGKLFDIIKLRKSVYKAINELLKGLELEKIEVIYGGKDNSYTQDRKVINLKLNNIKYNYSNFDMSLSNAYLSKRTYKMASTHETIPPSQLKQKIHDQYYDYNKKIEKVYINNISVGIDIFDDENPITLKIELKGYANTKVNPDASKNKQIIKQWKEKLDKQYEPLKDKINDHIKEECKKTMNCNDSICVEDYLENYLERHDPEWNGKFIKENEFAEEYVYERIETDIPAEFKKPEPTPEEKAKFKFWQNGFYRPEDRNLKVLNFYREQNGLEPLAELAKTECHCDGVHKGGFV